MNFEMKYEINIIKFEFGVLKNNQGNKKRLVLKFQLVVSLFLFHPLLLYELHLDDLSIKEMKREREKERKKNRIDLTRKRKWGENGGKKGIVTTVTSLLMFLFFSLWCIKIKMYTNILFIMNKRH